MELISMLAICSACFGTATEIPNQPEDNQVYVQASDSADELPSGELPPILEKCKKKKR